MPSASYLSPMLLMAARDLPRDEERWAFEVKFDGFRGLVHCRGGEVEIQSRNLRSMTFAFPELAGLALALGKDCILDGEIVAFDEEGRPDFERLQERAGFHPEEPGRRRRGLQHPVCYQIFDLLVFDGQSLMHRPYRQRREELERRIPPGPSWMVPSIHLGAGGKALWEASRAARLEGLVAKRLGSAYLPGQRTLDWLKLKNWNRQEFVIGGYKRDPGGWQGWLGGLMLGCWGERGLSYCGSVEAGFGPETLEAMRVLLPRLERPHSPFCDRPRDARHVYLEPILVGEVQFLDWTRQGRVRHASFKGFVLDREPGQVVREPC